MQLPLPLLKNVVLVGGGHAHALFLRKWAMNPVAGARVTVINPGPTPPYTGMLPGFVAGHYTRDELDIDLVRLARFADARFVLGAATSVDRDARTVHVDGRPPIPYDVCSINVGITSEMHSLDGFGEFGTPAKPLFSFAEAWTAFVDEHDHSERPSNIVVIGGGIGGCELAMAMNHRLRTLGHTPQVTVVEQNEVLGDLGDKAQQELRKVMVASGIDLRENVKVERVTASSVEIEGSASLAAQLIVGAAGAQPYEWVSALGLETHEGFLTIDEHLRSVTDPRIFAVGDCAHMGFAPRPKAGVYAVRQAPVLFENVRATLMDKKLDTFDPQVDYLKLISLGEKSAAADKFRQFVQGRKLWSLKNKIDKDFMTKLDDLPEMEAAKLPKNSVGGLRETIEDHPPLCGGCGAKVGIDILAGPLGELPTSTRSDVVRLPGDDAAVLDMGATKQVITTDQLRTFTPDPFRMATITTLHAMGDIWAMGGAPQAVLVTVTLPQLAPKLQSEWLGEVMAGTTKALAGTGAEVVGGHTSMGAELSLGYSITGLLDAPAITLAGATPGQSLILTRPLGSGLLFAAEMQRKARGRDVVSLLNILETPQGDAARILAESGATAMTDVTGFGLAGHLYGMLRESGVRAELQLSKVPIFEGALALANDGLRSHLHAANASAIPLTQIGNDPRATLLFDPQTAGGFLAAVPSGHADAAVARLVDAGHQSAVIGSLSEGEPDIRIS